MTPFRVLYRQFLFRLADLEALSAHAQGDLQKLLGQFASLLIFVSLLLTIAALTFGASAPAEDALAVIVVSERFLIATTMLAAGLFAVLCWDSTFPDRRDVLVLCPLPVRGRTMFFAKIAAVATALALVVALLHSLAGLAWPAAFAMASRRQTLPAFTFDRAEPPMSLDQARADLDRAIGPLPHGVGVTIGVSQRGERQVFAYGATRPDSVFEIGSVSKTFTSLILARMVEQGRAALDEPVRALLPPGTIPRPPRSEITLVELATHHSGLPRSAKGNSREDLYRALGKHGAWKPEDSAAFSYSNFGAAILGQALADRAGVPYSELVAETAAALGMESTTLIDPAAGYAPAGGVCSTAGDLLAYLETQLHPDRAPSLAAAIRATHTMRAEGPPGVQMALGWMWRPETRAYFHGGATPGFTTAVFFIPDRDQAVAVLANHGPQVLVAMPDLIAERIRQRLAGEPAVSLGVVEVGASRNPLRWFAAYWFTMLAAGGFVFCCVLAVQGMAAQILPRPWFLRVSGVLQMAAFCLFVGMYFSNSAAHPFDPFAGAAARDRLAFYPSYWFLGMFHQLNGSMHPALAPLARRAWLGLALAGSTTAVAYVLAFLRTLRRIVEQPDIVPGRRAPWWRPALWGGVPAALGRFGFRTLLRSRQHRIILAFYLGVGFALTIWFAKTPGARNTVVEAQAIAASAVLLGFWIAGARVVFSLPFELRANWAFRVLPLPAGPAILAARRRTLVLLSLAPALTIAAAVFLSIWPWRPALAHVAVLALAGAVLVEICAAGPQKLPFACSYLPGKSNVHVTFWLCDMLLFVAVAKLAAWEAQILTSSGRTAVLLGALAAAALAARWLAGRSAASGLAALRFEEQPGDAIQTIGLDPGAARAAGI